MQFSLLPQVIHGGEGSGSKFILHTAAIAFEEGHKQPSDLEETWVHVNPAARGNLNPSLTTS